MFIYRYKKHLIILKLIKYLKKDFDELLYISNNIDDCEHLKKINVCNTYNIKTQGMTTQDMTIIERKF